MLAPPSSCENDSIEPHESEGDMGTILIILLILLLIGAVPSWPYSRNWGYYPSGLLGIILLVVIILLLTGRL
jgi:hypothetical protein